MEIIDVYKSTLNFVSSDIFRWAPDSRTVFYNKSNINSDRGRLSLLHEISHALLEHKSFSYDLDLVRYEVEAWFRTKLLAKKHKLAVDEAHIEDCLDTYRAWLHSRSLCPRCNQSCLESEPQIYSCFNCRQRWSVSRDQTCQIKRQRLG